MTQELLAASLDQLLARARVVRDDAHGTRITYSPKVFIPVSYTHLTLPTIYPV